jgi:outer membrane receptor protein involved in Fe transport
MRYGWKVALGLFAALAFSTAVFAQRTTGGITGTVKDGTGAVLPGVNVDLTGEYVMGAQTSITNENGVYRFLNLSPGTYNLAFTITGFAPFNRNGLVVAVGMTIEENVTLNLSSVAESVTVTGASPVVDTIASDVGTNYDKDWVENAPVTRNSFHDFIAAAPGVVAPTRDSTRGNAMVYGSAVDDNSYQLDGTDVTDAFFGQSLATPNTDAIEEIEILSLGAPAEYGSVQGAVFNVVTKQGSNTFHGDANFYYQSDGLTGRNTTDEDDDGFPFFRDSSPEITAQLGGPIAKDKVWFFGSFQYQRDASAPVGVDPSLGTTEDVRKRFLGKVNVQVNPQHRFMGTFHIDRITDDYTPDVDSSPSTYVSKKNNTPTPGVGYTGLFGTNTVVDARYSGFYGDVDLGPADPQYPRTSTRFYDLDTGFFSGGHWYFYILDVSKTTVNAKVSHFADDFMGGSHDFKFGAQFGHAASGGVYGLNDLVYSYALPDGSRYSYGYEYQPFSYGGNTRSFGVFVDDTFQVNDRLTLNLGVRFDTSNAYSPEQPGLNEDLTETGEIFPSQDHFTWNTVSPRLGFNIKLTGDGRTVFKGHWGRYHRTITTGDFSNVVGPSIPPILYGTNFNFATDEFESLELLRDPSENLSIDPNMKSPYTDQFILSVDRELTTDLGLSLIYVNKRGRDFFAWRDVTGVYQQVPYVDSVGAEATGQTITVFKLLSDVADREFVMTNRDEVFTDVNAFTVQLNKRMSSNWQLTSALTYMKSEGRLGASAGAATLQRSGIQFSPFGQNPNSFVNTEGLLPGDRPWTFKNQLVYQLPFDFLIGLNYQYIDGAPRVRQVGINSVTGIFTRILTSPRAENGRLPSQNLLDLRVQKDFVLDSRGTRIGLFVDALNLLNEDSYEAVRSSIATSSSYELPTTFIFPRRFQVGAKFTF